MKLLKKENWWMWILMFLASSGGQVFFLGSLLDIYEKDSWYGKLFYKVPRFLLFAIISVVIASFIYVYTLVPSDFGLSNLNAIDMSIVNNPMYLISSLVVVIAFASFIIFRIGVLINVNGKLNTPGIEIYSVSYIWIVMVIIPILGWILFIVMYLYLEVWPFVMLYRGKGEEVLVVKKD